MRLRNLTLILGSTVLLSACGGETDVSQHYSNSGLIPEAYLPAEVGMITSYSSRDDEQFAAVQKIETNLGDQDRVAETATETLDSQFGSVGLDFERDLQPAFGDQFRMVYAVRPADEDTVDAFTITTLEDPAQMESVLETLVTAEQLSFKQLSDIDAYVNEENSIYITIYEDLLFITTSPENLVGMVNQEEDSSLWNSETYQDTVEELGSNYVFYGILYPSLYTGDVSLPAGFSVSDIPSVIDEQLIVVRAEEKGFRFDAYVNANKDAAKEADISFDAVPKSEPYLYEEVPADGLMAYFESYGLQQTFQQADALGDDTSTLESLRTTIREYFGMDFDEDILSFLDKGYAIALHQNAAGVMPGITIYVDVSSNTDGAEEFVNKLDGQLAGLMMVLEAALPGAASKDTVAWGDETFSRISIDLNAIPRSEESPLPTAVTESAIELVYGVEGDRLVISTATDWNAEGSSVAESELYQKLNQEMGEVSQGLILLDAEGLKEFTATLRALREQLGLQVSDSALQFEDFLDGFLGAAARSETKAYESHFGGFLMLAE